MTQPSRSMSLWNNPDSPSGITGFKDRLNTLMGKNSIRSFASECGISDTTIRKHLSGQSLPDIDKIEAIVKYTGCSLEWLSARCQSVSFIDNFSFLLNCENLAVTPWCNRVRQ